MAGGENSKVTIDPTPDQAFKLETQKLALQAGWLGKVFGTGANAPINIAGFTAVVLVVAGIVFMVMETKLQLGEYWKVSTPIVTLALGYLFGKKL